MSRTALNALAVVLVLASATVRAATATMGAAKDNTIYQGNPSHSFGGAAGVYAGGNASGSPHRGLIAFDVAGYVPADPLLRMSNSHSIWVVRPI